jgi:hypothetical protein
MLEWITPRPLPHSQPIQHLDQDVIWLRVDRKRCITLESIQQPVDIFLDEVEPILDGICRQRPAAISTIPRKSCNTSFNLAFSLKLRTADSMSLISPMHQSSPRLLTYSA